EVAELAPLAAERDVQVQAERRAGRGRPVEGGAGGRQVVAGPERERRGVGGEVVAAAGFFLSRFGPYNTSQAAGHPPHFPPNAPPPPRPTPPPGPGRTPGPPPPTAGDALIGPSSFTRCTSRPVARSSTYRLPSCDPTYTRDPATTGELSTLPSAANDHTSVP